MTEVFIMRGLPGSASWLHVGGDRGAGRHFDRDERHTEETRLMAQDWSRNGSWEKYSR